MLKKVPSLAGLLLVILSVLLVAGYYDYHHKVGMAPQSVHHWRQSDCASITYNFYKYNLPVRSPLTMGLVSDSGTSAQNLTSEVPVYYWGIAQLYKVFGPREEILRGMNTAIFLTGIIIFIYSLWLASGSLIWAILSGLLLFTAPVLVYYGNNYLTNSPALGLALIGLGSVSRFFRSGRPVYWWGSVLFFLLAGSLKITGLFLFFALIASAILFRKRFSTISWPMIIGSGLIVLLPLAGWLYYARSVNELHQTVYFSTTIFPVWDLNADDIRYIFNEIRKLWLEDYGHWSLFIFFLLLISVIIIKPGWFSRRWLLILILLGAGMLGFSLLQFYTFMQHDYYVINMYITAAALIVSFSSISAKSPRLLKSPLLYIPLLILLFFNIHYAAGRQDFRYKGFHNDVRREFAVLYDNPSEWLGDLGIAEEDSIIFIADDSHTSLYLMRHLGWTTHKMAFKDTSLDLYFNRDSAGIAKSIENGASYLVLNNWYDLYSSRSYLKPFCKYLAGRKANTMVFDLRESRTNFQLPERKLKQQVVLEPDSIVQNTDKIQETVDALSGYKVFKINEHDTYNFSIEFNDLKPGQLIVFDIWVKANPEKKLVPVISSLEPGILFLEKAQTTEEKGEWRHLKQEYLVQESVAAQGVKCFVWNPEGTKAEIDFLKFQVFESVAEIGADLGD